MNLGWKDILLPVLLVCGGMILPPFAPNAYLLVLPRNNSGGNEAITGNWPAYLAGSVPGEGVSRIGRLVATPEQSALQLYNKPSFAREVRVLVIPTGFKSIWASQSDATRELILNKLEHLANVFANRMEVVIASEAFRREYLPLIRRSFRRSFSAMMSDPETVNAFKTAVANFGVTLNETVLHAYARAVVDVARERLHDLPGAVMLGLMGGKLQLPEMRGLLAEAAADPLVLEAINEAIAKFIERPEADGLAVAMVSSMAKALREDQELFIVLGRLASDPRFAPDMAVLEQEAADIVVQIAHLIFPESTPQMRKPISTVIASELLHDNKGIALLISGTSHESIVGTKLYDFGAVDPR